MYIGAIMSHFFFFYISGNFNIHILTAQGRYELWIQLKDFENNSRYAKYTTFMVGDASSKYKLVVDGYHGHAGKEYI